MENFVELSGVSTEDLKKELERRGYFTQNLWSVYDVGQHLENYNQENGTTKNLNQEQCIKILGNVLTNEYIVGQIHLTIKDQISE